MRVTLVCPRDHQPLEQVERNLICQNGHSYAISADVPVLLRDDVQATHAVFVKSIADARAGIYDDQPAPTAGVDSVVQKVIAATGGFLYRPLIDRLSAYPIPELRLPPGEGKRFLELGSNWGRWCLAAALAGYEATGIDPSLEALVAARRVAQQLEVSADYIVADARHLPFADASFDVVFSYSVLQHFSKEDAHAALAEAARILVPGGVTLVQLPNRLGLRNLMNRAQVGFKDFDVRYWSVSELRATFEQLIGPAEIEVDGFFSLNAQRADLAFLRKRHRAVVRVSDALRFTSDIMPPIGLLADSLYVRAIKR